MQQGADNSEQTMNYKPTACVLCSMNCGLKVAVADNAIVDVKADDDNPISSGHSCNKAYSIQHYARHRQRLAGPLKKQADGGHQTVDWQDALTEISVQLNDIKKRHGGQSIAIAGLGGQANHSDVLYGLAWLKGIGSSWFFSAYAQEKTQHHLVERWMFKSPPHVVMHPDPWQSDVLVVIGCNPIHSNRGYKTAENLRAYLKRGNPMYVIDPRESETAKKATQHIAHKPGTDLWLLTAMVALILKNKWYDATFVSEHTREFDELTRLFSECDINQLCELCDVEPEALTTIIKAYATAERGSLFWDTGVEWVPHSTLVSWLLRVLVCITGNYGTQGGNTLRPGFMADSHLLEARKKFRAPATQIDGIPALGPFEMFSPNILVDEINAGNIKALVVSSANPLRSYADSKAMAEAFKKLELLVVLDTSYTETAQQADYVLATPSGYEKWEWSTFGRKFPKMSVHLRPPVLNEEGDVKTEAEIFYRILEGMKGPTRTPGWLKALINRIGYQSALVAPLLIVTSMIAARGKPVQAFVRWVMWAYESIGPQLPAKSTASLWLTCQLTAITRSRELINLPTKNPFVLGQRWFQQILASPQGSVMAELPWDWHVKKAIGYRDKKVRLVPEPLINAFQEALSNPLKDSSEFPLILAAGERTPWTANTIQRDSQWRKGRKSGCTLSIHPDTANALQLDDGETVRLVSATGQVEIPIRLNPAMRKDNVSMPNGMGLSYPNEDGDLVAFGVNTNDLTDSKQRDPFTGIPFHKTVPCRIEKLQ